MTSLDPRMRLAAERVIAWHAARWLAHIEPPEPAMPPPAPPGPDVLPPVIDPPSPGQDPPVRDPSPSRPS
jgi:hypothetical protein